MSRELISKLVGQCRHAVRMATREPKHWVRGQEVDRNHLAMAVNQAVDRIPGGDPTDLHWLRWSRSLHAPSTMLLIDSSGLYRHLIQPYTYTCTTFSFLHRIICMRKYEEMTQVPCIAKTMKPSTVLPLPPVSSPCRHSNLLPSLRTKLEKIGRCKTMPSPSIQGTCQNWAQQPCQFRNVMSADTF